MNYYNQDEQQERAIIRILLEFGLKSWDEEKRVADYMLPEFEDEDMIDNKNLINVLHIYKTWYRAGIGTYGPEFSCTTKISRWVPWLCPLWISRMK